MDSISKCLEILKNYDSELLVAILVLLSTILGTCIPSIIDFLKSIFCKDEAGKSNQTAKNRFKKANTVIQNANESTIQSAKTIYNGMQSADVVDLTRRTTFEILNERSGLSKIQLNLVCICCGGVLFISGREEVHKLPTTQRTIWTLTIQNPRTDKFYPNEFICSLKNNEGKDIPLFVREGTIELFPVNIIDMPYSNSSNSSLNVMLKQGQTAVGRTDSEVFVICVYRDKDQRFHFRTAIYGKDNTCQ